MVREMSTPLLDARAHARRSRDDRGACASRRPEEEGPRDAAFRGATTAEGARAVATTHALALALAHDIPVNGKRETALRTGHPAEVRVMCRIAPGRDKI